MILHHSLPAGAAAAAVVVERIRKEYTPKDKDTEARAVLSDGKIFLLSQL
jgi:hypothetical protein